MTGGSTAMLKNFRSAQAAQFLAKELRSDINWKITSCPGASFMIFTGWELDSALGFITAAREALAP